MAHKNKNEGYPFFAPPRPDGEQLDWMLSEILEVYRAHRETGDNEYTNDELQEFEDLVRPVIREIKHT